MSSRRRLAALVLALPLAACRAREGAPPLAIHLVDLHRPAEAAAKAAASPAAVPAVPLGDWKAGPGVVDLAVRDGLLTGRTTTDFPLIHLEQPPAALRGDVLHSVEVRLKVSAGGNVGFAFRGGETLDLQQVLKFAGEFPWQMTSPLVPGPELQTVTLRPPRPEPASELRHLLLRPTDVAGARFEIASVRIVSRREHLAGIPSGVSWQGLAQVYRETLVSRAPEALAFEVTPPPGAFLDVGLGTVEEGPVRFRVRAGDETLLERTVTTPHRWEPLAVDLARWAGRPVKLSLAVAAEKPGTLGLWGSPVVRGRRSTDADAANTSDVGPPQGVVLVWMDTLRRDHLGAYGYGRPTDPVLRRLAREGALFRHCVTQGTWTKVATPSLMTGLYPSTHGVRDFTDRLPAAATTLAEVYRQAGYATVSFSSILFTGQFTNLHQGFEEVHEDASLSDLESSKTSREYLDRFLPWLERHRDVPFFAFLHVADPHDPYEPKPPYDALWADPAKREGHTAQLAAVRAKGIADPLLRMFGMPTRGELEAAGVDAAAYVEHDRGWYDGSIRGMDAELGRLVERLGELGLGRRTLLVFAGDHGEEFLEHGRTFHGQSVYAELTDVPLLFWRPGSVPAGRTVAETVQMVDVMPTLLAASGLPVPKGIQGRSLLPLLASEGKDAARGATGWRERPAFVERALTKDPGAPPPHGRESYAVVAGGWRLIQHVRRPAGAPEYELYDERRDPLDRTDLAVREPARVRAMAKVLADWRKAAVAARLAPDAAAAKGLGPEELERLRSLGYIQ